MISVDSNLIFSAIEPGDVNHVTALQRLGTAGQEDTLVICPVVYAELMASTVRDFIESFCNVLKLLLFGQCPKAFGSGPELLSATTPALDAAGACRAESLHF